MSVLYVPFLLQAVLMSVDESLHHKRGLGIWERLGHPLDTLTVLLPQTMIAFLPYSPQRLNIYIGLALFSCFFITKDEFVHARECNPFEQWIHALLFVVHPIIFLSSGLLWLNEPQALFLKAQPIFIGTFLLYQISRWSIRWK